MKKLYISVADMCVMLGIGRTTAAKLIKNNNVCSTRLGGRRLIKLKSVKALMNQRNAGEA